MKLLEGKVEKLLIDVAVIKANYATKVDIESVRKELHSSLNTQTIWLIAALFVVLGVGLGVARLIF
ncbi:allantoicase [Erwinia persicina]|uniref:Hemolysin XhlA n=2 Tax=Erwinia TaxID=551 RepID=A0ABV4E515_9GAMM|nr:MULTISPECIES: hemolysin XhlA [Erwinia]MCP1437794.1 allantoicase [Erwinia persicina]MDN4628337.1 hemolysin XhlA [Erwinia sp. PsM31]